MQFGLTEASCKQNPTTKYEKILFTIFCNVLMARDVKRSFDTVRWRYNNIVLSVREDRSALIHFVRYWKADKTNRHK